jgi:hypothetical protein
MIAPLSAFGLDIDGTITLDPQFFSGFTKKCARFGIPVYVISSRSPLGTEETIEELKALGIHFDYLHLTPSVDDAQTLCPIEELDKCLKHMWLKVLYAKQQRISHYIDDDTEVLKLFSRFAPDIHVFEAMFRDRLLTLI